MGLERFVFRRLVEPAGGKNMHQRIFNQCIYAYLFRSRHDADGRWPMGWSVIQRLERSPLNP